MDRVKLLTAQEAKSLDEDLMSTLAFSIDQLMELAGLSVASAIQSLYPSTTHPNVLLMCGPGNNGGDGMVAARHLKHFGYQPTILYPKRGRSELYQRLVVQCESLGIPVQATLEEVPTKSDVVVDSIFGFSFDSSSEIREPFPALIKELVRRQDECPTVAVDVPSSWDVHDGDVRKLGVMPETLISLTAPKLCARHFKGKHHMLGGRFVPPAIIDKYKLDIPSYPGSAQFLELPANSCSL